MKVAIVGPEESKWDNRDHIVRARFKIAEILLNTDILISGHCPRGGVDIWAEEIADVNHIKKEIYPAEVNQWEDLCELVNDGKYKDTTPLGSCDRKCTRYKKGYRSRNIQIAEACDVLYCIVPRTYIPYPNEEVLCDRDEREYCKHCGELGHPSSGACWTLKYCRKHFPQKKTYLVIIE